MTTEDTTDQGRPVLLDIDDMTPEQGRMLATAVADLLVRGGGISGDMPLTGGHLLMFVSELADELERMRSRPIIDALDAAHFHVDASDEELSELGITREDALTAARLLRDEADPVVEREARWADQNKRR
jgi:hypothetical protein